MKKLLTSVLACYSLSLSADPSDAYKELKEVLPFNTLGFYVNAPQMQNLLEETQPKVVVELGSWLGASTRHIAQISPKESIVYAVDSWQEEDPKVLESSPSLYDQFLSNVIHAGLTKKIFPLRMSTLEAIKVFEREGIQPDLIYIDPSHIENDLYQELQAYFTLIKGRGVLCGDDWLWEAFQSVIEQFANDNNLHVEASHNFWVLRE